MINSITPSLNKMPTLLVMAGGFTWVDGHIFPRGKYD